MSKPMEMMEEPMIIAALAATTEDTPLWRAVHTLFEKQMELEIIALCQPQLTDSDAQYNRGRLAALKDMKSLLMQAWKETQTPG